MKHRNGMAWMAGVCGAAVLWASSGFAAEFKVAVVDMEQAIRAHADTRAAEELLKRQVAEFEAEQDDFQAQQEKLRKELEAARDAAEDRAISEREREKRMDVLKEKLLALRQLEQRVRETRLARQRELNEQEGRMLKRILVKVQAIIDRVAAEKGYALVLDSGARNPGGVPTVIFAQPTLDITEQVVGLVKAEAKTADTDARAEPVEAVAPTVKGE